MDEKWKSIPGYEGKYEASNLGNIRSIDRREILENRKGTIYSRIRKGRQLTLRPTGGFEHASRSLYVGLRDGKLTEMVAVDKIIASVWVDNPEGYECIHHLDGDKHNNISTNLEWAPYCYKKSIFNEEWRPVPGYEDIYEVSINGRIRSKSKHICRNRERKGKEFSDIPYYKSKELKPYSVTKRGVKYHLHRRTRSGYYGQSDEYIYAEELVRLAFPELR